MFVGAGGVGRVVQRTVDLMQQHQTDDVHPFGGINIDVLQRYINFHFSVSLDLFGAETSSNAANYFASGLKGRFQEEARLDDHRLHDDVVDVETAEGIRTVPALSALNATLRDDFVADCQKGLDRWNRILAPIDRELRLPHVGFHRNVGEFRQASVSPDGRLVGPEVWEAHRAEWLPNDDDRAHVASLMQPALEPGVMASWVAAPSSGIHGKPVEYEYLRL